MTAAKDRQEIELAAQRATLQEQRNHIGILDTALTNTQHNMRRLEEEVIYFKCKICVLEVLEFTRDNFVLAAEEEAGVH